MSTSVETHQSETKLIFPALGRFYSWAAELAYLVLRLAAGLMLIPHVQLKFTYGMAGVAQGVMAKNGLEPALLLAYLVTAVEILGIVCITLGLFTRPVAAALVIEFLVITKVHLTTVGWSATGGAEFPFIWLVVFFLILLHGGGRYSLDHKLGREI